MKRFITLVLLSLGLSFSVPSWAVFFSGNKLYELLTHEASYNRGVGLGYLVGVSDSINGRGKACVPGGVTAEQLKDLVLALLKERPDMRHEPADVLAEAAYITVWPCDDKKPSSSQSRRSKGNPV